MGLSPLLKTKEHSEKHAKNQAGSGLTLQGAMLRVYQIIEAKAMADSTTVHDHTNTPLATFVTTWHERRFGVRASALRKQRELISLLYHKYGKTVIKEMLSWDASDWEDIGQRKNQNSHKAVSFGASQITEIKNMFVLYGPYRDGTILVEDLAMAMADLHGIEEEDLLVMFENVGKTREMRVDADAYVDIFQSLLQDDDGMFEILKSTSSGDKLAEHVKNSMPKKPIKEIGKAPVRFD